jgi:hypothetical protein
MWSKLDEAENIWVFFCKHNRWFIQPSHRPSFSFNLQRFVLRSSNGEFLARLVPAGWRHSWDPNRPGPFTFPVSSTRTYAHALITVKINETIRNKGDPTGCVEDGLFVGPRTAAAKRSVLRLLPTILPPEEDDPQIYRLVLEHGDFGIHNMTMDLTANGPKVTSVFDRETGNIVLLSDTEIAVTCDLGADGSGGVQILRLLEVDTLESIGHFELWAKSCKFFVLTST